MPTIQFYSIDPYYRNNDTTATIEELKEQRDTGEGNILEIENQIQEEQEYLDSLRDNSIRLGMDLQGGVHLSME
jgi:preprotein translocase subunit SecD